eukprot:GDKH01003811.1.p1 GENE.GDKH01003811.1~~GDKH01003811.1.p1  ORF type:complete len:86 (+),score=5.33 GDKH01003811.1:35-259(+)
MQIGPGWTALHLCVRANSAREDSTDVYVTLAKRLVEVSANRSVKCTNNMPASAYAQEDNGYRMTDPVMLTVVQE